MPSRIKMACIQTGANLGTVGGAIGAESDSLTCSAFRKPSVISALPRISDGYADQTFTVDTTGLTPSAYLWRIVGGATLSTNSTLTAAQITSGSASGQQVECVVTSGGTDYTSPPMLVRMTMHMGVAISAAHRADDDAILAIVPHAEVTHIADTTGDWSNPATWNTGTVPGNGAFPLIANGVVVAYDETRANIRLDRLRIDGTLDATPGASTNLKMMVETIVVSPSGSFTIGTGPTDRVPETSSFYCKFSCKDYGSDSFVPTDLKASNFLETRGWARGLMVLGHHEAWGKPKTTWAWADAPVRSGETSLTLSDEDRVIVGIEVGDTILIGATTATQVLADKGLPFSNPQDEERVLTAVSGDGKTLSWTTPLTHPHDNQSPKSTRDDIVPSVLIKRGKNITFEGEVDGSVIPHRGAHIAFMHHSFEGGHWDTEIIGLGRTDKRMSNPAGKIDNKDDFKYFDQTATPESSGTVTTDTLTNTSNLQSRYPLHFHMTGLVDDTTVPTAFRVYVEGSPGLGFVHHDARGIMRQCAATKFYGAGYFSETGNETGEWNLCYAGQSNYDGPYLFTSPKNSGLGWEYGNGGQHGIGFAFTSRAIKAAGNVTQSCPVATVMYQRTVPSSITPHINIRRDLLDDLKTSGLIMNPENGPTVKSVPNQPILHFEGNSSYACIRDFYVTKNSPQQDEDTNVRLRNGRSVGCYNGPINEYVATYIFEDYDIIGGIDNGSGYKPSEGMGNGGNSHQIAWVNCRVEGFASGLRLFGYQSGAPILIDYHDAHDDTNNPRFMAVGNQFINCDADITFDDSVPEPARLKTTEEVSYVRLDLNKTEIDLELEPSDTFPLVLGTSDGTSTYAANPAENADGKKVDNVSSLGEIVPKPYDDSILPFTDAKPKFFISGTGEFWYYPDLSTKVARFEHFLSDRLTGFLHKDVKLITYTGTTGGAVDAGGGVVMPYVGTPVVGTPKLATCDLNGTVDVVATTGATGGNGVYELDQVDKLDTPFGKIDLTIGGNAFRYTAPRDFKGVDSGQVFITSGGRTAGVRFSVLVGVGGAVTQPVFTAEQGAGSTIDITLGDKPSCGGRHIRWVMYSTDEGATWKRLCNLWGKAVYNIAYESDGTGEANGTAIAPGTYNVRIKYFTNHENDYSADSADVAVTVS